MSASITEAHRKLAYELMQMDDRLSAFAHRTAAQLIANSEARAVAAAVTALTCTHHNNHARAAHEMFALNAQLEATVKNHTRNLKAALTKILRGTAWRMESAKYWLGIDHAVRPVAALLHVSIVIERFGRGKGKAEVRYNFAPAVQAEVLAEIERLVA